MINWTPVGASVVPNGQIGNSIEQTPVSGRVSALAIDPIDPDHTLYVGAAQGGVWKTTTAGSVWTPLTDQQASLSIGALAIDPSNHDIVYVGTGEHNDSGDSFPGAGLLQSADGGQTWKRLGAATLAGTYISEIIVDRTIATHLYLGCSAGVFESTDSGVTWMLRRAGNCTDMVLDDSGPPATYRLYAAFHGNSVAPGVPGLAVLDAGSGVWTALTSPNFPTPAPHRVALALCKSKPEVLYAVFAAAGGNGIAGIFRSTDRGATWETVPPLPSGTNTFYNLVIGVRPSDYKTVYVGETRVWRGTVADENSPMAMTEQWTEMSKPHGSSTGIHADIHAIKFHPTNPEVIWVGSDGGAWLTTDHGSTWNARNRGLENMQYYSLAQDSRYASVLLAGAQDNGTQRFGSHPAWKLSDLGDGTFTAIEPSSPWAYYAGNPADASGLEAVFRSDRFGEPDSYVMKLSGVNRSDRALFIAPFAMDPSNQSVLYLGTDHFYQTVNRADDWQSILDATPPAPDLVSAIAVAPSDSNTVYVGSDQGNVWQYHLAGGAWTRTLLNPAPVGSLGFVSRIAVDPGAPPAGPLTIYVAIGQNGRWGGTSPSLPRIWRCVVSGAPPPAAPPPPGAWTDLTGSLPALPAGSWPPTVQQNPANALVIDPAHPNLVYMGCDVGVFRYDSSAPAATAWTAWNPGLPNAAVFDLLIHPTTRLIRAATHGRGVWERPLDAPAAAPPPIDIYLRDNIGDIGRVLPSPSGAAATDPFNPDRSLGMFDAPDVKLDTESFIVHHFVDPISTVDYTAGGLIDYIGFDALGGDNPRHNRTSRVYVQVHNRGPQEADPVQVRAFWVGKTDTGFPDLPAGFWTGNAWLTLADATPSDVHSWHPLGLAITVNHLRPAEPQVVRWDWTVPGGQPDHVGILAVITSASDPVSGSSLVINTVVPGNKHVALKELDVNWTESIPILIAAVLVGLGVGAAVGYKATH